MAGRSNVESYDVTGPAGSRRRRSDLAVNHSTSASNVAAPPGTLHHVSRRRWLLVPAGGLGGLALGVVARLWMRWISTSPEFTWSGTLFIVGGFTVFGMSQGIATAVRARDRSRSRTTAARVGGWLGAMPLFGAAGAIMLPTVLFGSLAAWRTDWRRAVRLGCVVLAGVVPALAVVGPIVGDFGVVGGGARSVGLAVVYAPVIVALRATFAPRLDGWRVSRRWRIVASMLGGLLLVYLLISLVGLRG